MKLKAIFYSILFLFLLTALQAQDNSKTYLVRYQQTLDFYNNSQLRGSTWSALNYEGRLYFDGKQSAYYYGQGKEKETLSEGFNYRVIQNDNKGYVFHRDTESGILFSRDFISDKPFIIREEIPEINWTLKEEYKEVGGYTCQLAVGSFRGRTYEAWFTEEIPIPTGPWKLGGLPGLIMEAQGRKSQVKFLFASLSRADDAPRGWRKPPNSGTPISYDNFVSLRQRKADEVFEKIASMPGVTVKRRPYKGIELVMD